MGIAQNKTPYLVFNSWKTTKTIVPITNVIGNFSSDNNALVIVIMFCSYLLSSHI